MEKKVYVVEGSTGEYSDQRSWLVAAFEDENAAKDFVNKCQHYAPTEQSLQGLTYEDRENITNPHDPHMSISYTGTWYNYHEIPLYSAMTKEETESEMDKLRKILG